jgi:Arc/MetJ-type ribon-helix-helix transcriptional regulator
MMQETAPKLEPSEAQQTGCGLQCRLVSADDLLYGECMARFVTTTVRLGEEDVRALKRARAAGLSASDLIRKGLRVVASRYYSGRRPPSTGLFESTDSKLGDESELFRDIDD